jgi:glycosyltransferase involved in cell wall biosynthesis
MIARSSQVAEKHPMQFHVLSFEGPDPYARVGGLASRAVGLVEALADLGYDTHLWFVGDPELPGHESLRRCLHLHRWCQWLSSYHPGGVYDGEEVKQADFAESLPRFLLTEVLTSHIDGGGRAVVLAEEWQTAGAVVQLDTLLRAHGLRDHVELFWNANNTFGFERIDWPRLAAAARITTVSRYMKHRMWNLGLDPLVIPNGLRPDCFEPPDRKAVAGVRGRLRDRTVLVKMARWDPDKRWLAAIDLVSEMKQQGWRPVLLARGGLEAHREEVFTAAWAHRLLVTQRSWTRPGAEGLVEILRDLGNADVVELRSHVDPDARRVLFRAADAVLANSGHEPFGLVGLEAMAAGGVACTGCSGEDYAVPGHNALVVETGEPGEFLGLFSQLLREPGRERALRRAGVSTARRYAWPHLLQRVMLPRVCPDHATAPPSRPRARKILSSPPTLLAQTG